MGLTGIITSVNMQLVPVASAFMSVQYHQGENLDATLALLSDKSLDDSYTVMWVDCSAPGRKLGRSVLLCGHHATSDELPSDLRDGNPKTRRPYSINFDFPSWLLNSYSTAAFNELYYRFHKQRKKPLVQHYDEFFFPLDRIGNWNRMYGRRGFIQYQCVFPLRDSARGLQLLLEELRAAGRGSFLSVLKLFGPGNKGQLSFPIEGYTLTLDLPLGDPHLLPFLDRLDELVVKFGGRVYLAKDARMRPENFKRMYSKLEEWRRIKRRVDPKDRFQSDLSRRLKLSNDGN
jgi:FAD/FMN-containing dehydrogenase